ncbi:unnamed protein product [Aspergillus oryzae var. brunneus]|uniref:Unnamed protein product n=2 Tax=Aspergillus oryzae TaxID=5062 RepID=A0AAN4YLX4_ASPOZ|nr:unnamed protein product [Aspergillus oryzae]GMG29698.1 unnamed protein product [Aspergillus oryzae]GMG46562.1 unnamed protein product [Aspergillus oryzae var. brunneus]
MPAGKADLIGEVAISIPLFLNWCSGQGTMADATCVVTGSSRDIGATTTIKLAQNGANVVVDYPFSAGAAARIAIPKDSTAF